MPRVSWEIGKRNKMDMTLEFIREAHEGQMYGDNPYFMHPLEVALEISPMMVDAEYPEINSLDFIVMKYSALCHDVVEDTDYGYESIISAVECDEDEKTAEKVVEVVKLLTKLPNENYDEYLDRLIDARNVNALIVKYADNVVNYRGDKTHMKPERCDRLLKKYENSMERIKEALKTHSVYL